MALYFIRTVSQLNVGYVVNSKDPVTKEEFQKLVNDDPTSLRDLAQVTTAPVVEDCFEITTDDYFKTFDHFYPNMANMDRVSKLLQIHNIDDGLIESVINPEDKDQL